QKLTVLCDKLRNFCRITQKPYSKLIADIVTRWNSTYHMLCQFKKMHDELDLLTTAHHELKNTYPNKEDSYPSIFDVRLTFMGLFIHIDQFKVYNSHLEAE
ncbi:20109_t:CDS:2, partial [Racocetra persica]